MCLQDVQLNRSYDSCATVNIGYQLDKIYSYLREINLWTWLWGSFYFGLMEARTATTDLSGSIPHGPVFLKKWKRRKQEEHQRSSPLPDVLTADTTWPLASATITSSPWWTVPLNFEPKLAASTLTFFVRYFITAVRKVTNILCSLVLWCPQIHSHIADCQI